ncbi:Beta-hexosaminidase eukaryotic type N-terminal [Trinorchestia longiramus]|nr:Beta-hexosaminidase eukaryotic type N-terminal [Trinorchestia longiramus]
MLLMGVVTLLIGLLSTVGVDAGGHPYAVPTVGQVWPKPQMTMSQTTTVVVDQDQFSFSVTGETCPLLERALQRYLDIMFPDRKKSTTAKLEKPKKDVKNLSVFEIRLLSPCEDAPYLHMDEQYEIKIVQKGDLRLLLSSTEPRIDELVKKHQAHPSH